MVLDCFLVQHGEAKSEQEDPSRPLTEKGRDDVKKVAMCFSKLGMGVSSIYHSGKLRARQTAEILCEHLRPSRGVFEVEGLSPMDNPQRASELLKSANEPVVIVGHLPHLSRLVSLMVVGDETKDIVKFRMGAVVCISRDDDIWRVSWILTPEIAGGCYR